MQALTGLCIVQFGYRPVLMTNALFALGAAALFFGIREHAKNAESGSIEAVSAIR